MAYAPGPDQTELGEEELKLLETSFRFVADASAYDQFIDTWSKRLESIDEKELGKIDDFLINRYLSSLTGMIKKIALDDRDPNDMVEDVVSSVTGAAVVLSPSNLVVTLNDLAADHWSVLRGSATSLSWIDPSSMDNLEQVRRSATHRGNYLHSIIRTITAEEQTELAEVFVLDQNNHPGLIAVRALNFIWNRQLSTLLADSFGLTEAEVEVCRLLLDLRETDEIARVRDTSVQTVRTQLRMIFAKTETSSQVDLVRLLGLVSSHITRQETLESGKWQDPLGRQRIFQDKYGRNIAYSWMGDPDGRPALLSHGMATGYLLHPKADSTLRSRKIKLYCLSRPGFGDSQPAPHKNPSQGAAEAMIALAEHLQIEKWIAVGLAVGIIPIFQAARDRNSRIEAIIGSSAYIPFPPDEDFKHFSPARRIANRFARTSPVLTELAVMITYRMMRIRGPEHVWDTMYSACEADKKAAKDPDCVALIRTAASFLTAQKHKALTSEMRMIAGYWYDDFIQADMPVHFLHGADDPAIPIDRLVEIASAKKNMTVEEIPDAGELLFFYHYEKLISLIEKTADKIFS